MILPNKNVVFNRAYLSLLTRGWTALHIVQKDTKFTDVAFLRNETTEEVGEPMWVPGSLLAPDNQLNSMQMQGHSFYPPIQEPVSFSRG